MGLAHAPTPLRQLQRDITRAAISGIWSTPADTDRMPADAGAYLLAIRIDAPLAIDRPRLGAPVLPPGCYLYAGSARGPGGLRARVGRHFRRDKPCRWHVDSLTLACGDIAALLVADGDECILVSTLLDSQRFQSALPGFGSSDCRRCESHLLRPIR